MVKTLFLTLLAAASTVAADVTMQPTRIALFKNGYGFVTLSGTLDEATQTRLGPLPVPSVGTFWVGVGGQAELRSLVAGMREFKVASSAAIDMGTLIASNPGKKVSVSYSVSNNDAAVATGTIQPMPGLMERTPANVIGGEFRPVPGPVASNVVMLKTDAGGTVIIPTHVLRSLSFEGECTLPESTESRPAVELELAAPAPGAPVEVTCLASGISWQPSYLFTLGKDGKGTLTAKATISNNLMDIRGADVELITGNPSLENAQETDPIALNVGAGVPTPRMMAGRGNKAAMAQAVTMNAAYAADGMAEMAPAAPMGMAPADGVQTADLFFYPLDNFSAKAGEVVVRPLFSVPVDYRSLYVWEVGDPQRFTNPAPGEVQINNEVWHCIRFTNPLKMPLTTAYVEFLDQGRIAGTNTVSYTPPQKECTARMNQAVNVPVFKKTELVDQQRVSIPHYGNVTRNTSRVTLALTNGTGEAMDVEIIQRVNGSVTDAGEADVQVTGSFSGPGSTNPATIVRWKLHLEPGEVGKVGYTYSFNR